LLCLCSCDSDNHFTRRLQMSLYGVSATCKPGQRERTANNPCRANLHRLMNRST